MKYLIFFISLSFTATLSAETFASQYKQNSKEQVVLSAPRTHPKLLKPRVFLIQKRHAGIDKLAIVAICLDGVPVLATLITYLIWGGFAAGFMLAFSSVFALAGMLIGIIALIRAAFRGWRRGTFWAVIAVAIPLFFIIWIAFTG